MLSEFEIGRYKVSLLKFNHSLNFKILLVG